MFHHLEPEDKPDPAFVEEDRPDLPEGYDPAKSDKVKTNSEGEIVLSPLARILDVPKSFVRQKSGATLLLLAILLLIAGGMGIVAVNHITITNVTVQPTMEDRPKPTAEPPTAIGQSQSIDCPYGGDIASYMCEAGKIANGVFPVFGVIFGIGVGFTLLKYLAVLGRGIMR